MTPDTWNREELYEEVWESPLIKVATKYGISAVALGKVCRKLQIPLPGRGYWTKKEFGKPVERVPLPEATNLPVVRRMTGPSQQESPALGAKDSDPSDPEMVRILAIETADLPVDPAAKPHKLIGLSRRALRSARLDERGMTITPHDRPCLEVRVSKGSLDRALLFMNAIIQKLEKEGFPVSVKNGREGAGTMIFGHWVPFALVEKARAKNRRQVQEYSWTRTVVDYEPSGELEFRILRPTYSCHRGLRDRPKQKLESQVGRCVAALMREGRDSRHAAEAAKQRQLEAQKHTVEMAELYKEIQQEEKKVQDLDTWVTNWARAEQTRAFIAALEKLWAEQGHDLSLSGEKGQRIAWMKQQADRVDPMLPSPPSILDRKKELGNW